MRLLSVALLLASGIAATPAGADAAPCPEGDRPWVQVELEGISPTVAPGRTLDHLRAELATSGITVCAAPRADAPPALATVRLRATGEGAVSISVEIEDAVTRKGLSRELDLSATPNDARALAVALGATELLRASWAELKLSTAPTGRLAAPPEVHRALARDRDNAAGGLPEPGRLTLGLTVSGEEFSGGLRELGVDLRAVIDLHRALRAGLRVGPRRAESERGPNGMVEADGWLFGLTAAIPITQLGGRSGIELRGRGDALQLHFQGIPLSGATIGSRRQATALTVGAGFASWVRLTGDLLFEAEVLGGTTARGVIVHDGADEVLRADGLFVGGALGLALRW